MDSRISSHPTVAEIDCSHLLLRGSANKPHRPSSLPLANLVVIVEEVAQVDQEHVGKSVIATTPCNDESQLLVNYICRW